MFLKKSLLFATALALLMFAGQASAQLSLSLGEGGSATVTGAGTEIAVDVSQMGVDQSVQAIQIVFDVGTSVTLTGAPGFLITLVAIRLPCYLLRGRYRCPQVPVLPLPQLQM